MMLKMFTENFKSVAKNDIASEGRGNDKQLPVCQTHETAIKSPSDMTIYKPAFKKVVGETQEFIETISNFVESIRIDNLTPTSWGG